MHEIHSKFEIGTIEENQIKTCQNFLSLFEKKWTNLLFNFTVHTCPRKED